MYEEHFGLTGRPFRPTPDPAFWYETATHRRALAYLGYGLAQGEGIIFITGDVGCGKTTLAGHLLDTLDLEVLNPIKLVSTAVEASDLLRIVTTELGVDPAGLGKAELLAAIEHALRAISRSGRRTLLIVDDAQVLPTSALDDLRVLSTFQEGGQAPIQIMLLGQSEFRAALHGSEQLHQRVIANHHLGPMAVGEVALYIRHRLGVVGWKGRPAFADSAFVALHRHSEGVPRGLNLLADRVMLQAAIDGTETITAATVDLVAANLQKVDDVAGESATVSPPRPFRHSWLAREVDLSDAATPEPDQPVIDPAMTERLVELEARVQEQDAALRRVVTLLVDWVETDQAARPGAQIVENVPRGYAPIRGAAA